MPIKRVIGSHVRHHDSKINISCSAHWLNALFKQEDDPGMGTDKVHGNVHLSAGLLD